MAKGTTTLEELHQFFENDPDDHQLETQAEARLKALYHCLVNGNSRTTLQIGLTGLLTYVKASQRSTIIDEVLQSKDYISEIISLAADHFLTTPLLSATCLYECMLTYPKKFSPFLINKFRPLLGRIIYKKIPGPNEICCKCLAQVSVLGIPSSSKQTKSWKTEFDRHLRIASVLIDQIYIGIGDFLCSDVQDFEAILTSETGDLVSSRDYASIFSNCCHVLKFLLHAQLETPIAVPTERTLKLIFKVLSLNAQQFNILHRKENLSLLLEPIVQLCDVLVTLNPSILTFNLRQMLASIVSLLDIVHQQTEYSKLSSRIFEILSNFFAIYNRQIRFDLEILQKLLRWIVHDTTIRVRSKTSLGNNQKADLNLTRTALNCLQQLVNVYSDRMPRDEFISMQNHFLQTLMNCQLTNNNVNKPYDDELCRVGLYQTFESFLLNERADCPTLLGIGKSLIDRAMKIDSSVKVKMIVRKLQLIWLQVRDSTSQLYQSWSFFNVDKPRNHFVESNVAQNDLHHVFMSSRTTTIAAAVAEAPASETMNTEPLGVIHSTTVLNKPMTYEAAPIVSYTNLDLVQPMMVQSTPMEAFVPNITNANNFENIEEHQRKRTKFIDTRITKISDDDDDGAEQIFADNEENDDEMMDEDEDELDESDEVDDDDQMDEENESDLPSSEDDNQKQIRSNGLKKMAQHLGLHEANVDLLDINRPNSIDEDNLHKKFRRSKSDFPSLKSNNEEMSAEIDRQKSSSQINGQNLNNGPSTTKQLDNFEMDDDVVYVSDDDDDDEEDEIDDDEQQETESESESEGEDEQKSISTAKQNLSSSSKPNSVASFQQTRKGGVNVGVFCSSTSSSTKSNGKLSTDLTTSSVSSEVQETIEALRDAVVLVSDDFTLEN